MKHAHRFTVSDLRFVRTISFILSWTANKGTFTIDNTTYQLGAGEGFIIEPGKQTFYQADAKEPWTYFWIGFDGTLAKDMLSKMGLGQTHLIFRCNNGEEMRDIIFDMLKYNRANDADEFMIPEQSKEMSMSERQSNSSRTIMPDRFM